jgi:hypothetical protein
MMTGRELSRPFVEYSSDWVRANVRPPQPIGESGMTKLDTLLTNARITHDWLEEHSHRFMAKVVNDLIDALRTRPLTGGVTEEMTKAGCVAAQLPHAPSNRKLVTSIYLAMKDHSNG